MKDDALIEPPILTLEEEEQNTVSVGIDNHGHESEASHS